MPLRSLTYSSSFELLFFLAMLAVGLLLPTTGDHSAINPKALALFLALAAAISHLLKVQRVELSQLRFFLGVLSIFLLLGLSIFIHSLLEPYEGLQSTFDQCKVFVTTALVTLLVVYWYLEGLSLRAILLTALFSNMAYSGLKLIVMSAMFLGYIDIFTVLSWGFSTMTTGMGGGLIRLQTSTDIPTPYLLFFALLSPQLGVKLPRFFLLCYLPLSLSTLFFSFSRFLWATAAIGYLLTLLVQSPLTIAKKVFLGSLIALIGICAIGIEESTNIIWSRFLSEETKYSDLQRYEQVDALLYKFSHSPCFGHGLGAYSEECIRAKNQPHSYEVQWVAFLMQFGFLGTLVLFLACMGIISPYLEDSITPLKVVLMIMFLLWLLSGFTNPFLISMNSGTMYGLFYIIGKEIRKKPPYFSEPALTPASPVAPLDQR